MEPIRDPFPEAITLFNRQAFFECHEVLEDLWRPLPAGAEKTFLQGLIQVAVGFYHLQRGNYVGAKNKLESGLEKLMASRHAAQFESPVALAALISACEQAQAMLLVLGPGQGPGQEAARYAEIPLPEIVLTPF